MNTTAAKEAIDLSRRWSESPRWGGIERDYTAEDVVRLRGSIQIEHTLARHGAREALPPPARRGLRAGARRAHRRPGGADGEGRAEGDLPLRLAGGGGRQPGDRGLPRPEPLPGQQRARHGAAAEQRAPARRPGRVVGRPVGGRLPRADRRRRGGRLRRPAQRVRADEGHDRGGRGRRPLRGPAGIGEEVRPPRRQGARPDEPVHPHAARRAARGRRAAACPRCWSPGPTQTPRRSSRATWTSATASSSPASARRRASSGPRRHRGGDRARPRLRAVRRPRLDGDLDPRPRRGARVRRGDPRRVPGQAPRLQLLAVVQLEAASRRRRRSPASRPSSGSSATSSSSSRSPASTPSTSRCSSSPTATRPAACRAYVELQQREFELEEAGYTATRHQREVGAGYFDRVAQAVSGGASSTLALRGSTEEAQFDGNGAGARQEAAA